jgi:hypothetical protein
MQAGAARPLAAIVLLTLLTAGLAPGAPGPPADPAEPLVDLGETDSVWVDSVWVDGVFADSVRVDSVWVDGAGADSLADSVAVELWLPHSFDPSAVADLPFLVPSPFEGAADTLFGISAFDAFLAPPRGPSRVYDRLDLRLAGQVEVAEILGDDPAVAVRPAGYPGTVPSVSFHGHGPEGTAWIHGGRGLEGGLAPLANPNPVSSTSLAGMAVLPVTGSHLHGPGAGGGTVHFMPLVTAPPRPFSEVVAAQGIFGQKRGSVTVGQRFGDVGFVYDYRGASARPWTLFDGYRSERHHLALDLTRGRIRVRALGRIADERLLGFDRIAKRSDDGRTGILALEARLAPGWLGAARVIDDRVAVRADGRAAGFAERELQRTAGELLLWRRGERSTLGLLAGVQRDGLSRLTRGEPADERFETTGHGVLRGTGRLGTSLVDLALRMDRTVNREWTWALGGTLHHPLSESVRVWLHGGRVLDRATYVHTLSDAFTQVEQGMDLPFREGGQPILTGWQSAAGLHLRRGPIEVEVGGVLGGRDRLHDEDPDAHAVALSLDEPDRFDLRRADEAGGWGRVVLAPLGLGSVGRVRLEAAGFLAPALDDAPRTADPRQHGHLSARLHRSFFGDHLEAEGELIVRAQGAAPSALGTIPAVSWVDARITFRVLDLVLTYRSENVFGADVLSLVHDEAIGYLPVTSQNILVGISWILLD